MVTVERLDGNPMIEVSSELGSIVNHPSLINVPEWVDNPLGKYYLYFSHKFGDYIRLAYADDLNGPWEVYGPGALHIDETPFVGHIASPDVHVDYENEVIRMYYHGETATRDLLFDDGVSREYRRDHYGYSPISLPYRILFEGGRRVFNHLDRAWKNGKSQNDRNESNESKAADDEPRGLKNILRRIVPIPPAIQETRYSESTDGITFQHHSKPLGPSWMAVFRYNDDYYAIGRDGYLYHTNSIAEPFNRQKQLFVENRHFGVYVSGDLLEVYYSRPSDHPERILRTVVHMTPNVNEWTIDEVISILSPETIYEGVDVSLRESQNRSPTERRREVRDPYLFCHDERKYIVYSGAGQSTIAIARIDE